MSAYSDQRLVLLLSTLLRTYFVLYFTFNVSVFITFNNKTPIITVNMPVDPENPKTQAINLFPVTVRNISSYWLRKFVGLHVSIFIPQT